MRGAIHNRAVRTFAAGALILSLAACGGGGGNLYNLSRGADGPDEFAILPTKPIELPEDLAALPAPTPGGANRVDPTPEADAFAALGGNADVLTRGGDPRVVNYASRYGVDAGIRQELAVADAAFRETQGPRLLERVAGVTTYYRAYSSFALNAEAELQRFRRAGVGTPTSPPPPPVE